MRIWANTGSVYVEKEDDTLMAELEMISPKLSFSFLLYSSYA